MRKWLLLIGISCLASMGAMAQPYVTVGGQIVDDDSEEPIPFASVAWKGKPLAIMADEDGYYTLTLEKAQLQGNDSLVFSAVGYMARTKPIHAQSDQTIHVRLASFAQSLEGITVFAGENPADRIVRQIVANRSRHELRSRESYQVENYTKTELDIDNLDARLRDQKLLKPFDFVWENIDSVSDVKPFLPAFMEEELADIYYVQRLGAPKYLPRARRVSGVENQSVVALIGNLHEAYSLYDNWIELLDKPFASPFSSTPFAYYEFYIQDSAFLKNRWCYKLKFKPKRQQENTFFGDCWVDMENWAIVIANLRMSPDVNINFVERVILYHECDRIGPDSAWLPSKEKAVLDFVSTQKTPGLIARKTKTYRNYRIDDSQTALRYDQEDPESVQPGQLIQADTFWETARHEALSRNEESVYQMIDSVKKVPVYRTYVDVIRTLVTGFKQFGPIEIGPVFNIVSQNAYEGLRFQMGVGTSTLLSKKIRLFGYAAYGLRDRAPKFGGEFQLNLQEKPFSFLGGAYRNDVDLRYENSEEPSEDNLFAGVYRRPVPQKLLLIEEGKFFVQKGWQKGWSNRFTLLHRTMAPLPQTGFHFRYLNRPEDGSTVDSLVTATEMSFRLRFAYKEQIFKSTFSENSLGSKYPVLDLQYTASLPGVLGAKYTYHKFTLGVTHWFNVAPIGWMRYHLQAGKIFGNLPYLLLEVHDGNETYFYLREAFNGMNRYEFVSDQWVQLNFEHHWDGFFLNRIPLLRKLKWREVFGFKAIYGSLTENNLRANRLNHYDRDYTDYRDQPIPGEGVFYGTFDRGPYVEVSAGIENILRFIRIDALWRLNYYDARYATPFTLRGTMAFNF